MALYHTKKATFDELFNERYEFKIFIIYVQKINNLGKWTYNTLVKNKPKFNFILPKIRRYITTQNTLEWHTEKIQNEQQVAYLAKH